MNTASLISRGDCSKDATWAATQSAYTKANTDGHLKEWWANQSHGYFARQLAGDYGDRAVNFQCGIGSQSQCIVSGCAREFYYLHIFLRFVYIERLT